MEASGKRPGAAWLQPPEDEGLKRYLRIIRDRISLIVAAVAITTLVAVVYVMVAEKTYEAEADVLVTPIAEDSPLTALGLISRSTDPLRETETAARLIENQEVAKVASDDLGDSVPNGDDPYALLLQVNAEPVAESSIVAVQAEANSPTDAAEIANAFANAAIEVRTDTLQKKLDTAISNIEDTLASSDASDPSDSALRTQLSQFLALKGQSDPTLSLETEAVPPDSAAAPKPLLSVIGAIVAGLVLGIGAALALQLLDPRIRNDEELRKRFQLPILARVPRDPHGGRGMPIPPWELEVETQEGYRVLRNTLGVFQAPTGHARSILITSAGSGEGKSTTTLGLAASLAAAGNSVIVIEADLRKPRLGSTLQLGVSDGVVSVLVGSSTLQEALQPTPEFGNRLRVLLADHMGPATTELFSLPAAQQLIADAATMADYVVIDSAPMNVVVDTMPLAKVVDDLVICVRLGKTKIDDVTSLGELLAEYGVRPSGFAIVGTTPEPSTYYHQRSRSSMTMVERPKARREPAKTGESAATTG